MSASAHFFRLLIYAEFSDFLDLFLKFFAGDYFIRFNVCFTVRGYVDSGLVPQFPRIF